MAERTTSFAKSVEGLHHEESALDRARSLRDQFVHAQEQNNEKQKSHQRQQGETEKSGSQMVRQDAPHLQPAPSGPMRQAADRFTAYRKLEKEHKKSGTNLQQKACEFKPPAPDKNAAATKSQDGKENDPAKIEAAQKAMANFYARQQQIRDHERDRER
jgi:hypothetical protein